RVAPGRATGARRRGGAAATGAGIERAGRHRDGTGRNEPGLALGPAARRPARLSRSAAGAGVEIRPGHRRVPGSAASAARLRAGALSSWGGAVETGGVG